MAGQSLWTTDAPTVFGRAAVRRVDLVDWAHRCRFVLPPTRPRLFDFTWLHLDSLLVAIREGAFEGDDGHALRAADALLACDAPCDATLAALVRSGDVAAARHYLQHRGAAATATRLRQALSQAQLPSFDIAAQRAQPADAARQRERRQRQAALVFEALVRAGVDVQRLPRGRPGEPDPSKRLVRRLLSEDEVDGRALDRAWKQLLQEGRLRRDR